MKNLLSLLLSCFTLPLVAAVQDDLNLLSYELLALSSAQAAVPGAAAKLVEAPEGEVKGLGMDDDLPINITLGGPGGIKVPLSDKLIPYVTLIKEVRAREQYETEFPLGAVIANRPAMKNPAVAKAVLEAFVAGLQNINDAAALQKMIRNLPLPQVLELYQLGLYLDVDAKFLEALLPRLPQAMAQELRERGWKGSLFEQVAAHPTRKVIELDAAQKQKLSDQLFEGVSPLIPELATSLKFNEPIHYFAMDWQCLHFAIALPKRMHIFNNRDTWIAGQDFGIESRHGLAWNVDGSILCWYWGKNAVVRQILTGREDRLTLDKDILSIAWSPTDPLSIALGILGGASNNENAIRVYKLAADIKWQNNPERDRYPHTRTDLVPAQLLWLVDRKVPRTFGGGEGLDQQIAYYVAPDEILARDDRGFMGDISHHRLKVKGRMVVSPNGKAIAALTKEGIAIIKADNYDRHEIVLQKEFNKGEEVRTQPCWSSDNKTLIYSTLTDLVMWNTENDRTQRIPFQEKLGVMGNWEHAGMVWLLCDHGAPGNVFHYSMQAVAPISSRVSELSINQLLFLATLGQLRAMGDEGKKILQAIKENKMFDDAFTQLVVAAAKRGIFFNGISAWFYGRGQQGEVKAAAAGRGDTKGAAAGREERKS